MSQESDSNLEKTSIEFEMIYGEPLDCRGPMRIEDEPLGDDPVHEFVAERIDELSKLNAIANPDYQPDLGKILGFEDQDIDEPPSLSKRAVDPEWDELIPVSPVPLSNAFLKRSDARLERVAAKIRKLFGNHQEEMDEAIQIAKDMRDAVRQEFIRA